MSHTTRNLLLAAALAVLAMSAWWLAGREPGDAADVVGERPPTVLVQAVTRQPFDDEVEALGTTRAVDSVDITARVTNIVTALPFREGDVVERGTVLVELENSEARAELAAAEAALVESRSQYERSRELLRTNSVSTSQVEQLQATLRANEAALAAAQARMDDHRIRAPFGGRIGLRRVSVGTLVTPGTVMTTLDDTSTVLLDFDVPETHLSAIERGQTLTARSAAYTDREFTGTVRTVDTRVDPNTRAVTVRAELPNADGLLRAGMFMTVRVLRERADLLLVPEHSVVPMQARQHLFVVVDGVARLREVELGRRAPGSVEVVSGIDEGDVIVVEGTQRVRDGQRVETRPWPGGR